MDKEVKMYLDCLIEKKTNKNTYDAYSRDILRYTKFLESLGENVCNADVVTIRGYVMSLKENGMAESSIVRNVITLRNFYKFLMKEEMIKEDPTLNYDIPRSDRKIPDILTVDEVDKLLKAPDRYTIKGIRDKAMLELMYACGLKVSELLNLKISDINLNLEYITCVGTKNKERVIPVGSYGIRFLKEYLMQRDNINKYSLDYLFLNLKGLPMTRQGFWKIIKGYGKEVGIEKQIDPYTLRHSFAVHLLQNGADLKSIQELLGHTDIATTEIYTEISKKSKLMEVYKKTHPRA